MSDADVLEIMSGQCGVDITILPGVTTTSDFMYEWALARGEEYVHNVKDQHLRLSHNMLSTGGHESTACPEARTVKARWLSNIPARIVMSS
jgi:hypothetical protein